MMPRKNLNPTNDPNLTKKGTPRKPHSGGGTHSPVIGDNGLQVEKGDTQKFMAVGMEVMELPLIDLNDSNAVHDRLIEFFKIYFDNDMKPTLAGMGLALNLTRHDIWVISNEAYNGDPRYSGLNCDSRTFIKRAVHYLEQLWESYMLAGKINPVTGIFLAKNQFGYVDQVEHILSTGNAKLDEESTESISGRYIESPSSDDPIETDFAE